MTRRVVQTDLFAAFKESQQLAEEQYGQKRKIHVEGTSLRQAPEYSTAGENAGYEVIIAKNTAPTVIRPEPQPVVAPEPVIVTTNEPAVAVAPAAPAQPEPVSAAPQPVIQEPAVQEVEHIEEEEKVVIKPAPAEPEPAPVAETPAPRPTLQAVVHEEIEAKPTPEPQPVAKPAQEVKRIEKPTDRIKIKPVEKKPVEKKPVQEKAAPSMPRKTVVTRKGPQLKQSVNRLKKENVEHLTVSSTTRQPLKQVTPAKSRQEPVAETVASEAKTSGAGNLIKIALIIGIITAAYIIGTKKDEPVVAPAPSHSKQAPHNSNVAKKAAVTTESNKLVAETPKQESVPTTAPLKEEIINIPVATGNSSVLLCGDIGKRSADRLKTFLMNHETVKANGWEIFEYNTSIFVGRFESRKDASYKKCVKFCKNLEYEGRKQFPGAMFFPLPKHFQIKKSK